MSESAPSNPDESRRSRLFQRADANKVPLKTILTTIVVIVLVYGLGKALYRLRDTLLLLLLGGFLALVLNPLVDRLERTRLRRRGLAVLLVALGTLVLFAALAFAFGYPLVNSLTHLANALPGYVKNAQHGQGWIGHLIRRYHISTWFAKNSSKLVSLAQGLSKPALALGKGAVSMLVALITLFAFVVLLLLEAPKIRAFVLDSVRPARAERLKAMSAEVSRASLGFVLGSLLMSFLAAVVVFVTLWATGVPFAFLFALWVLLVDFLPQIGGALAGFPTVLFAFGHSTSAGVITAIVFVVFTLVQNHAIYPLVMGRAVKLNPLVVFVAILVGAEMGDWVGGSFGGLVGVLLAVPLAAAVQVVVRETWNATKSRTGN